MTERTTVHGLQVATVLKDFIDSQVLPGSGLGAKERRRIAVRGA